MNLRHLCDALMSRFALPRKSHPSDSYLPQDASPPPIIRPIWNHPWLRPANISRFATYSAQVRQFAMEYAADRETPLRILFANNMAQSMYKWAGMASRAGHAVELQCREDDACLLSLPEWEEYDGEEENIFSPSWRQNVGSRIPLNVPCHFAKPACDIEVSHALHDFCFGHEYISFTALFRQMDLPPLPFALLPQLAPYYLPLCTPMRQADVVFSAADHIPSLLSGRPYDVFIVGGDADILCSRRDVYGMLQRIAIAQARFVHLSNPHALGHCRRMGWGNAVHVPYPMDDARYCPGHGGARAEWEAQLGKGCYVLTTARIDSDVKGFSTAWWEALCAAAQQAPTLRFVMLRWGADAEAVRQRSAGSALEGRILFLKPVGKTRLIDYYRSCDIVMDQLNYGYYGATGLEAAACGRPVVMFLCQEQYAPLYCGDVAPVENCATPSMLPGILIRLAGDAAARAREGEAMRAWLTRNHGESTSGAFMLALLRLAADRAPLPPDLLSPLLDTPDEEEVAFNKSYEDW